MSKGKPVLGRGLASLIPRPAPTQQAATRQDDGATDQITANIDVERIRTNPYQPRADFDPVALNELKQSIAEKGIIQPVTVCRIEDGYQLISGERRLRACRDLGMAQIPAYIIKVSSREEMLELALVENLQREQLNPIEIAISYKRLLEECSLTQEEVSQRIGKDRTTITNFLRLLKLPELIQMSVRRSELSAGHARALIAIEDDSYQMGLFKKIVSNGLSVREVERLVREGGKKSPKSSKPAKQGTSGVNSALQSIEENLRQTLGTKVDVKPLSEGRGQIVIEYYSLDDLDRLLDLFVLIKEGMK